MMLGGRIAERLFFGRITTGAEPWAVVASPDARRVFVSNSGQDTVTVLDVANRRLVGHIELRVGVAAPVGLDGRGLYAGDGDGGPEIGRAHV